MASNNGVFPELVLDIGPSTTRPTGATSASPLGALVENTLRSVLGWRPRPNDPKGFLAALNQSFTISDMQGHTEFTWTPHSYAIQADMGAVTGAQASIYARAKAALDQSVPLLEGLFPLRSDDDEEDIEAIRAIVISKFTELVNELSTVGGPRIPRVDDYFTALLGSGAQNDPETVAGLFGKMRDEFGLERELVNTIDEEQNLTNYLIVVDHVIALQRSWINLKDFFNHSGPDVFLGTQLVELSRALGVVAESVQELYFVMDSVFLGAAERQTIRLRKGLTIDELFSWVERFTIEEAPRLIREGGKDGVIAFRSTVTTLVELVDDAKKQAAAGGSNPQQGFHHPRTVAALEEVTQHVVRVATLTDQLRRLPRPDIQSVVPSQVFTGVAEQQIMITGNDFQSGAEAWLTRSGADETRGPIAQVNFISSTTLLAIFDLREGESEDLTGEWTVVVKNPDGGFDWKGRVLTVEDPIDEAVVATPLQIQQIGYMPNRGRALRVVTSANEELAFGVNQVSRLRVTFNKSVRAHPQLENMFRVALDRTPIPGVREQQGHELYFTPDQPLSPGLYTITLIGSPPDGLADQNGARLNNGADSTYHFEITEGGANG